MLRTVVWVKSADDELATFWLATGRSEVITKASYQIEHDLRTDASGNSSDLTEGLYVIERGPLRAVPEINEGDRLVRVLKLSTTSDKKTG